MSREIEVYERLTQRGGHDRVLRYHGPVESGIRLEYAANGSIRTFYTRQRRLPSASDSVFDGPPKLPKPSGSSTPPESSTVT
jgi:hypothetical protein